MSISGNYTHRQDNASVNIAGAAENGAAFREEISGRSFSVTIAHLPAGKYTISIGEAETLLSGRGERLFDVTSGDVALAKSFDIVAAAGGAMKVCTVTGAVQHDDDSVHGPLTISFSASKNAAKFNTLEVKDDLGDSVVAFNAAELAAPLSPVAASTPEINASPIWRDPSQPLQARENDLIRRMSLAEKIAQLQNGAPAIRRFGLPAYDYWSEALHGVANNGNATVFPQAIGMAATWDPALIREEASVIGIEGRAKFNDYASKHNGDGKWFVGLTFWSPNINIFRDPRWGRGQETYGEDPFLTGTIGVAFIRGLQGDDPQYIKAVACAKHYAVHSGPEPERHRFDAKPSERDFYETYLPHFEMAIREGRVGGVMGAYNSVDGIPACASSFLLTDLLRKQWGFEGYVVSDCGAIHNIWGRQEHHYVNTAEEAAACAVKAGCNLCCGGDYNALLKAVQSGLITEKEIDQALYYTLWTRFKLGLFDPPGKCPYSKIGIDQNDTPEHEALARKVAEEAVVLLKNEGVLPLDRSKIKRIAVIGPNADAAPMLEGNYNGRAARPVTVLNGIKKLAGPNIEVTFAAGCPLAISTDGSNKPTQKTTDDAVALAGAADVVVFVSGITARLEGEEMPRRGRGYDGFLGGDRTKIELPSVQTDLIKALAATNKPVILVNCSGSPMAMPWECEHLPAILQAWYPGEQGGRAVGEILFGDVNPSGRLPLTFYASTADLPSFTDYSMSNRTYRYFNGKPAFAFGHGLSYTKFEFANGELDAARFPADGTMRVSFTVKNSGGREGDEVAQVYFRHFRSGVPQPKLALCSFSRVHLKPGQSSLVTVEVPAVRLRYWDAQKTQYAVEPGEYEFLIGAASDDIRLKLPTAIPTNNLIWPQPAPTVAQTPAPAAAVPTPATPVPTKARGVKIIRIKAGQSAPFKDSSGNVWKAEEGFEGGNTIERPDIDIANTKEPGLYRSEHYSMDSFSCNVPNGKYIANLHFAETFEGITGEGQRVFSFSVHGHEFKDFDVWKKAGGPNRAYVVTVPVEVTDGKFKITFTSNIENPQINAIEVIPQTGYPVADGPFKASMDSLKQYKCPDWFRDAKFGIWAHWGPQAVPMDGDWYARGMYEQGSGHYKYHLEHYGHPSKFGYKDIIPLWKAEKWDPDRLMDLYKKAGAKYFVSMGSHHDNFFLWDSKLHKWNAVNMGPKRDVVGDWQKAAKKLGLRFGVSEHLGASFLWFQSSHRSDRTGPMAGIPYDGADPKYADLYHFPAEPGDQGWYSRNPRWQQQWYSEIKELVDNYQPDLLYTDGPVPFGNEVGLSMIAHLYNSSAARNGGTADVVYNCKQKSEGRWVQDLERGVMAGIDPYPWQTDTSIGDWFYNRNWKFRPVSWVIDMLVDNVSKNGNLLLNVVQRPDGSLDPEVEQMLGQLADWTAIHGEAIYGSRPWLVYGESAVKVKGGSFGEDFKYNAKEIRFTTKGPVLYAIALGWPEDGQIVVHSLAKPAGENINNITVVSLLGYDGQITWKQTAEGLIVTLPEKKVSEYTAGLKIIGSELKPVAFAVPLSTIKPDRRGNLSLDADAAELHGGGIKVEQHGNISNIGFWDNSSDWASWKVDFTKPGVYKVTAQCALPNGEAEIALEVAGQQLIGKATPTGDWGTFADVAFGTVEIAKRGVQEVKIRPRDANAWKAVNLSVVKFVRGR